jgi:hypothetical protein
MMMPVATMRTAISLAESVSHPLLYGGGFIIKKEGQGFNLLGPFCLADCAGDANSRLCFLTLNVCVSEGFDADNDGVGDSNDSDEFGKHLMYSLAL